MRLLVHFELGENSSMGGWLARHAIVFKCSVASFIVLNGALLKILFLGAK